MALESRQVRKKKTAQVGFKVDQETFDQLEHAATVVENRPTNQLARLLFEWAFDKYREIGSYWVLTGKKPDHISAGLETDAEVRDRAHGDIKGRKKRA